MSIQTWHETISPIVTADGPTLTAAAAASCIPTMSKFTLPNNFWQAGRKLKIVLEGRISNVVTTPGTGRFDVRLGGTVIWDSGAFNLNTVAKTNVPWWLEIDLRCRAAGAGTATTFLGFGSFTSEALVGSPANTAGGNGSLNLPVGAPTVGAGVDATAALTFDMFFTQTVATGSLTVHDFEVVSRV
jgi:hypothetical protein